MRQFRVYPYKMGSKGASLLSEGLREAGERCFKVFSNRRYTPRRNHTIINWGCSSTPDWVNVRNNHLINMLNDWVYVGNASNKLKAFKIMKEGDISIPEFTTDNNIANNWGCKLFGRKKLQGHSGEGIIIFDPDKPLEGGGYPVPYHVSAFRGESPVCPLYVKYIKKKAEYRVHVFQGRVIDIQMKRKRRGVENEEVDYQVRNHKNGWVYCRDDIHPNESVISNSIRAVDCLGLDFGAVDVIWNEHHQKAYVLEVNCAPGLEGQTLTNYVDAFKGVV